MVLGETRLADTFSFLAPKVMQVVGSNLVEKFCVGFFVQLLLSPVVQNFGSSFGSAPAAVAMTFYQNFFQRPERTIPEKTGLGISRPRPNWMPEPNIHRRQASRIPDPCARCPVNKVCDDFVLVLEDIHHQHHR